MKRWIAFALVTGTALFVVSGPLRAMGGEEEGAVGAKGRCTAASTWDLEMAPEVGVTFEGGLETGVPDQQWHLQLMYNKHVELDLIEVTDEDGGFEFVKVEKNAEGEDTARLRVVNLETGELCWGELRAEI